MEAKAAISEWSRWHQNDSSISPTRAWAKSRHAGDGGGTFLDKAAEVLGGLVLLAVGDGVVVVEDVAVAGGEDDVGGDGDEVAGGLTGGGVVGEGRDGLGEDGAVEGGVGVGVSALEDAVFGAGVELANDGLGEGHLGVVGLDVGGEDGDGEGADVCGDVGGGAGGVVAAAGMEARQSANRGRRRG